MRERRRKGKKNCNDESNEKKRIVRRMEIYISYESRRERERETHPQPQFVCPTAIY